MWTLALETTTALGSLALLDDAVAVEEEALESRHYSASIFQVTELVLERQGLRLSEVHLFAVADGPGSFTGVRMGLTAVKGWVEVLGTPAVPVSTLRAAAEQETGPRVAALDASRGEVYYGVYPEGEEGLETLEAFRLRLARLGRPGFTPHAALRELVPELTLCGPRLAAAVGRLGLEEFRAGRALDALRLDARYLRRSDAELYAKAL